MINTTYNNKYFFGDFMAQFIIKMDTHIVDSESNILAAGATILKQYKIPGMYLIQAEAGQTESIMGLTSFELSDTILDFTHAASAYDISHLTTLGHDTTGWNAWNPKDQSHGLGSVVYLVDTGIDQSHVEFLNANIVNLHTEFTDFTDSAGHGTSVASLIVGGNIGVSPSATVVNIKLFDSTNSATSVISILDAFDALIEHHVAADSSKVKIVCLPWTATKNQIVDQALTDLLGLNLLVVAAAGNQGTEVDNFSPGGLDTVITVGALDRDYNVSAYSNMPFKTDSNTDDSAARNLNLSHAKIDTFALGTDVCVATIGDNQGYSQGTGTSLSAALVSGVLCHYTSSYPDADASIIKAYMLIKGYTSASRMVNNVDGFDRTFLLGFENVAVPEEGMVVDFENVNFTIAYAQQSTEVSFAHKPSGRLINIKKGEVAQTTIGISPDATDVSVLDFTPISPWMTLDLTTGALTLDASDATLNFGIYHFAVKGTVSNILRVEEYSVGIYENSVNELNDTTGYYYDVDTETYEEAESVDLNATSASGKN